MNRASPPLLGACSCGFAFCAITPSRRWRWWNLSRLWRWRWWNPSSGVAAADGSWRSLLVRIVVAVGLVCVAIDAFAGAAIAGLDIGAPLCLRWFWFGRWNTGETTISHGCPRPVWQGWRRRGRRWNYPMRRHNQQALRERRLSISICPMIDRPSIPFSLSAIALYPLDECSLSQRPPLLSRLSKRN